MFIVLEINLSISVKVEIEFARSYLNQPLGYNLIIANSSAITYITGKK